MFLPARESVSYATLLAKTTSAAFYDGVQPEP